MILKTALKNIRKSIPLTLLTCLQMIAAMIVTAVMISSILLRYRYYAPLKDYYTANGIYGMFIPYAIKDIEHGMNVYNWLDDDKLRAELDNPIDIVGVGKTYCELANGDPMESFAYTDNLIRCFQPDLSEGRWLSPADRVKTPECVISQNPYGWKVGDDIELEFFHHMGPVSYRFHVVGMLKDDVKIPGGMENNNNDINFMQFYRTFSYEIEEHPMVLMNLDTLKQLHDGPDILRAMTAGFIITYPDDVSQEQLRAECRKLASFCSPVSVQLSEIQPNNLRYLYRQVYDQLPIIIVLLVLTIVSCISSSAITTRSRLRDYAVFYVCGLRWKQCILINFMQSLLCGGISFLVSLLTLQLFQESDLLSKFKVVWSQFTVGGIAVIFAVYVLASLLMPLIIIGHNTPKEILSS